MHLSKQKNIKIKVIDNLWRGTIKYIKDISNIEIIIADLTNYELCLQHIKNVNIVYHLAEIVSGVDFCFLIINYLFIDKIF